MISLNSTKLCLDVNLQQFFFCHVKIGQYFLFGETWDRKKKRIESFKRSHTLK